MATITASLWPKHRTASTSLAFCVLEFMIVWGSWALVHLLAKEMALKVWSIASAAWILGGLASIISAVIAILVDPDRKIGALSLALAVMVFFVCGLTMLV